MSSSHEAPVVNAWTQPTATRSSYIVRQGDTVYSIAWAFGLDYRALAAANNLPPPYAIHPGQRLRMTTVARGQYHPRHYASQSQSRVALPPAKPVKGWRWPARGRVISGYSRSLTGNRGINIAGRLGEPILAAASGVVVYSGDGVRGYGNLIIIKHNASYLSAYAYNKVNLVQVGQRVRAGQPIAEMGQTNGGQTMLHFEIRFNGQPVNPIKYLR